MADTFDAMTTAEEILAEHGPLDREDLEQRLRDAGVSDPDDTADHILDEIDCPATQLADDRWIWLPSVLAGRVFTHRVGADEAAHDLLVTTPDLDPITELCNYEHYQRLADGSPVQNVLAGYDDELFEGREIPVELADEDAALLLAPGTLAASGITEGDLVGIRLTPRGLAIEAVTAVTDAPVGAALAATLDADEPELFDVAVWTACVTDPALFTEPTPPLSEVAADYGLAQRGDWLAPSGFDFARWDFERGCARLAAIHDLDDYDAVVLYTLVNLYTQISLLLVLNAAGTDESLEAALARLREGAGTGTPEFDRAVELAGTLGAALVDPELAELLVDETSDSDPTEGATLKVFAELLEARVPPAARVACRWLRAVALERMGDIDGHERELLAAESMNGDWPLPLLDLARIASDRGDAEGGLALLHRAGAQPDYPLMELLQRYRCEPRRDLGRNQPCWCGSGRKYKKCHLGREQLPLSERTGWLYAKAFHHMLSGGWRGQLFETAYARSRYMAVDEDDEDDPRDAMIAAMGDPLVVDAVLFEGGAFEKFLSVRGSLLPDDERLLAEQWLLVDRSVFDVEQVRPGHGITVRDVRSGDTHEVRERTASRQLKPGQLICARVVPAGDTMQIFGGLEPVALHERGPLIELLDSEPEPEELVAWLSRRFAPPSLANTEGDPMVLCEARVRIGDPARIQAALDDTYERDDDPESQRWFEHVITHGMERIRATVALDGDTLRVDTNSEERMGRVLATLARLDPAMQVLDDTRHPIRDTREAAELAEQLSVSSASDAGTLDPDDPEVAAAIDEFIRDYETKWLDEPIPALDGHTPRQAADDPTRRGDLIKLLDSFPAGAAARGGMDADRLRDALGLD